MTTILAHKTTQGVMIACDSAVTQSWSVRNLSEQHSKVIRISENTICGIAGNARLLAILSSITYPKTDEYNLKIQDEKACRDWIENKFLPLLKRKIKELIDENVEEKPREVVNHSCMIIAMGKHIFTVTQYCCICLNTDYASIGSGAEFAEASILALRLANMSDNGKEDVSLEDNDVSKRVAIAMNVAKRLDIYTDGQSFAHRTYPTPEEMTEKVQDKPVSPSKSKPRASKSTKPLSE